MNAQELLNKYIKYNSKITFDIFKLIYQKLIDLGFTSPNNVEKAFKEFSGDYPYFVMKLYGDKPYFNQYNTNLTEQSEISVEDILGYNPFESFTLPEQWCIKVQEMKNTPEEIVNWRLKIVKCGPWSTPGYLDNAGYHRIILIKEYIEITLEQFKQYVLKEPVMSKSIETENDWSKASKEELLKEAKRRYPVGCIFKCLVIGYNYVIKEDVEFKYESKGIYSYIDNSLYHKHYENNQWAEVVSLPESKVEESVPEYVECFYSDTEAFIINKIYKCESLSSPNNLSLNSEVGLKKLLPYNGDLWKFKPSTKEAFEEQNKPKSIEKWSVGSYIVPLQDRLLTRDEPLIKGKPYQITKRSSVPYIMCEKGMEINFCDGSYTETTEGIKWFATLTEAEEFAKTLVNPVNYDKGIFDAADVKQPLKQVVHCKTQEEWDFVTKKLNRNNEWEEDYPCQILVGTTPWKGGVQFCIDEGFQILSFQEWCDLNGYKMKKIICKKGDCYVVTKECPGRYGTLNFCYQALVDHTDAIYFETNSCISTQNTSVRPATLEEIGEYNRIGKPYDVTTLQSKTINTYGLNIGDKLDAIIIAAWEKKSFNYFPDSSSSEKWIFGSGLSYDKNRKIEGFKVIDGVVGFLVSGTLGIYLRAEGFKEFADNYYTEITSNFKVGSWYKCIGYYLKYSKTNDRNIFIASEYIDTRYNEFKDKLTNFTCGIADGSKELVTDLSVIQQYLPEGHPDLFNTENKEVKDISKTFTIRVTSKEVKRIKI